MNNGPLIFLIHCPVHCSCSPVSEAKFNSSIIKIMRHNNVIVYSEYNVCVYIY